MGVLSFPRYRALKHLREQRARSIHGFGAWNQLCWANPNRYSYTETS